MIQVEVAVEVVLRVMMQTRMRIVKLTKNIKTVAKLQQRFLKKL